METETIIWNDPTVKRLRRELSEKWDMVYECEKWRGKFCGTPGLMIERIWEYEEKWARFCQMLLVSICQQMRNDLSSHAVDKNRYELNIPIRSDACEAN